MEKERVTVIKPSDLRPGSMKAFDIRGRKIAVANVEGTYYAFDDTCTHEECSLAGEGDLVGSTVTCMCHGAEFDVRTGQVLAPPAFEPLRTYHTHADADVVQVEIDD